MQLNSPVNKQQMAIALSFNRNSFYYQSRLEPKDKELANAMEQQHRDEDDTLGHRKLAKILHVGKNKAKRVMKKYGIEARVRKKKYNYPGKSSIVFTNLANDDSIKYLDLPIIFTDIFEFTLADGTKVRGCFALHKQTRQILALIFDYSMRANLVASTIQSIDFGMRSLWHSDQGKQFGAKETTDNLLKKGFIASMSRAGTPTDNPYAERFVSTFKHAVVRKMSYENLGEFLKEAGHWINFYNYRRPHEGIDQMTPVEFARINGMQIVPYLVNLTA
jgi:putative transposase